MANRMCLVPILMALVCCRSSGERSEVRKSPEALAMQTQPDKPQPPPEPTPIEKLQSAKHLAEALAVAVPLFEDSRDTTPPGAAAFAVWSAKNLAWDELSAIRATKRALIMKDPPAERGRRLCTSGTIIQIRIDRSSGEPIADGVMMTSSYDAVKFLAVRSTGDIVENSIAAICGIAIGVHSYGNTGGGVTHSALIVGMFDLPDNRAIKAPAASSGSAP